MTVADFKSVVASERRQGGFDSHPLPFLVPTSVRRKRPMHPHAAVINTLFSSLDHHDPVAMQNCYADGATFKDMAFDLHTREDIGLMWLMISKSDLRCAFHIKSLSDDGLTAEVQVSDSYHFSSTGRRVVNEFVSKLTLNADGLITHHEDVGCPQTWAKMAWFWPLSRLFANNEQLRRKMAMKKLAKFKESLQPVAQQPVAQHH